MTCPITQYLAGERLLFVFPHPDDEIFSCTALWRRLRHETPGLRLDAVWIAPLAPQGERWTRDEDLDAYGRGLTVDFARARERLTDGLVSRTFVLPHRSREVGRAADDILAALESVVARHRYSDVFCCPLEGAHPDHDFVHAIVAAMARERGGAFCTHEYSSYHLASDGALEQNTFLEEDERVVLEIELDEDDVQLKGDLRSIYRCEPNLNEFRMLPERFRRMRATPTLEAYEAPTLYYETWPSLVDRHDVAIQLAAWSAR